MQKAFLAVLFLASGTTVAKIQPEKLKCLADDQGRQPISLEVKPGYISQYSDAERAEYKKNKVIVAFYAGTENEGQQALAMELNGYSSIVYDPKESLYILESPDGVKIQCYIEQ